MNEILYDVRRVGDFQVILPLDSLEVFLSRLAERGMGTTQMYNRLKRIGSADYYGEGTPFPVDIQADKISHDKAEMVVMPLNSQNGIRQQSEALVRELEGMLAGLPGETRQS